MTKFKPYPSYKDSGVEWLGEVPEGWVIGSFKNLAKIQNGRDYKEVECSDGEYPVIGSGGQFSNTNSYLYDGESVLLGRKGTIDKPLYINGRFWTVDTMFYTEIPSKTSAKFLYYLALTIPFGYYSTNTALPSMTQDDLLNHPTAIPPLSDQKQIARFLDHETARMDELIEEQERLIELLKEKRQALISHAVTKGLDPTVPMKDSGVEWLGEVPAHWEVLKLKRIASLQSGDFITSESIELDDNYPVYGGNGLRGYTGTFTHEGEYVLIGRQGALCGNINYAAGRFFASEHAVVVSPNNGVVIMWIGELLRAMNLNQYSISAAQPGLAVDRILNLYIPFPNTSEQTQIARFLDQQTARIDALIKEAERGVELLQERRSALISAAVTGKIDVRGWRPPGSSADSRALEVKAEALV